MYENTRGRPVLAYLSFYMFDFRIYVCKNKKPLPSVGLAARIGVPVVWLGVGISGPPGPNLLQAPSCFRPLPSQGTGRSPMYFQRLPTSCAHLLYSNDVYSDVYNMDLCSHNIGGANVNRTTFIFEFACSPPPSPAVRIVFVPIEVPPAPPGART